MLPKIHTILYTTALGKHTRPVFRFAVSLAQQHNAKIILLNVAEPLSNSVRFLMENYLGTKKAEELRHEANSGILEKIHSRLEAFCKKELDATLTETEIISEIRVTCGTPCEVILEEADRCNADLIVMGTHTHSDIYSHLLGSTARRVTLLSKRPVLIIPIVDNEGTQWNESVI
ncbi:MAG: universal stress protein UspA [Candidatus Contendobacter odensis]|uniref:Universal stress protein UspA n=1 Tax=Candidatus Contendibacter odensensis TaxID=1400860 RepID=A0A2G6PET2_9GAMM|nr:MAG: universal stress protein UspA [Candidatus Contendobacter odensis]